MGLHDRARRRRAWAHCARIGVVACAAASGAAPTAAALPAAPEESAVTAGRCPLADATPAEASARGLRGALRCLVNRQRRRYGLARLADAPALDRVAQRFAADMQRRGYFAHVSPEGRRLRDRVRSAGLQASGEVIAWGCGRAATPAAAVLGWVASPPHRRVLLSPRYTVIGAGVADGAPGAACGPGASTSVVHVGRLRGSRP